MEGNQMKMRETLLVVRDALDTISAHEDDIEFVRAWIAQTKKAVQEALSAPARQCDVGTADEQNRRFDKFCREKDCNTCPCNVMPRCHMVWAQMPYEQEGDGDGK